MTMILIVITGFLCAFCVWKALQSPRVLSIVAADPGSSKDRR